jgi:OOP family OmpA-OmpF porin
MGHVVQPIRALVLFAALGVAADSALAQRAGLYLGAGIGATQAKFGDGFTSGIAGIQENKDESDKGGKLFAGVQFNRWFALEAAYHELGKFSYDYNAPGVGSVGTEYHVRAWNLSGQLGLPFSNRFSVLARGGAGRMKAERSTTSSSGGVDATLAAAGVPLSGSKPRTNLTWGFGAEYDFSRALGLRFDYDNYGRVGDESVGRARIGMYSLNAIVRF